MPRLAPPLGRLRDNNLNVKWAQRPRSLDGWIGDSAHQARKSDHNPNSRDVVDALDVDATKPAAPKTPIHVPTLIASAIMHPSMHYVIHKRRIMSAADHFQPRAYTGEADHNTWVHLSIFQTVAAESSAVGWKFILKPMIWSVLKLGMKKTTVKELQAYLIGYGYAVAADGDFGPKTLTAVKAFQRDHGLVVDGVVGPKTRSKLRPFS
jgi:hypothetical protein